MNKKWLFWFSVATGFLTLGVGTGIFLLWWIARAWFAIDFSTLEGFGFLWIFIAIPFSLIGLITSSVVISANSDKNKRRAFLPLIILLLNIPAAYIIIELQSNISERVYFKVFNKSGMEFSNVQLISNSFQADLGELENQESLVDHYVPTYLSREFDSVPDIEGVTLQLSTESETYELQMPYSMKGWCQRIIVTDSLTLKSKWVLK